MLHENVCKKVCTINKFIRNSAEHFRRNQCVLILIAPSSIYEQLITVASEVHL